MLKQVSIFLLAIAAVLPSIANAIGVDFATVSLGGDDYRYDYVIRNDGSLGPGASIQLVDLLFDPAVYDESTLSNLSAPELAGPWTQTFLSSGPGVPAAFDLYANGQGIEAGAQVSGFSVGFRWLGTGTPGPQPFEVYDYASFALLEQGLTSAVPEPQTWVTLSIGGLLLASIWRRRSFHGNREEAP